MGQQKREFKDFARKTPTRRSANQVRHCAVVSLIYYLSHLSHLSYRLEIRHFNGTDTGQMGQMIPRPLVDMMKDGTQ